MSPLASWCLVIGLLLFAAVLAKLLSIGTFSISKKQPPAVRISPEWMVEQRDEIVFNASKRVLRSGQQRVGDGR